MRIAVIGHIKGYDLVQKHYGTEHLATKIMSMIEELCVVKVG